MHESPLVVVLYALLGGAAMVAQQIDARIRLARVH
jgi:hypothetical protein